MTKEMGDRLEEEAENLYKDNSLRADRNTAPPEFYYNGNVSLTWRLTDSTPAWVFVTAIAISGTGTTYR